MSAISLPATRYSGSLSLEDQVSLQDRSRSDDVNQFAKEALSANTSFTQTSANPLRKFVFKVGYYTWNTIKIIFTALGAFISYIARRFFSGCEDLARKMFFREERMVCRGKVVTDHTVAESLKAYEMNKALLTELTEKASTPSQVRQAEFLAENYLAKGAPIHMDVLNKVVPGIEEQFQVGEKCLYHYHRTGFVDTPDIAQKQNSLYFSLAQEAPLIPTDTIKFTQLYSLSYHVVQDKSFPYDVLTRHFEENRKEPLTKSLKFPLMFDLTDEFQGITEKEHEKEAKAKLKKLQKTYSFNLEQTVELIHDKHPQYSKRKIRTWIKDSSVFISRVEDHETSLCGIKVLPIFKSMAKGQYLKAYPSLVEFIKSTGIFISAVNLRRLIWAKPLHLKESKLVEPLFNPAIDRLERYIQNPDQIRESTIVSRCKKVFDDKSKPHFHTLGMGTLALFEGLLNELSPEIWCEIEQDQFKCEIIQSSLVNIVSGLLESSDNAKYGDFGEFSLNIELIHAEFAKILEIVRPFKPEDYAANYQRVIDAFPGIDPDYIKPGLCKTGVNAFAGITAAIYQNKEKPIRVYGKGFYFEQAALVGYDNTLDSVLEDESIEQVDLFACQFNSNIEIDSDFTHYSAGKIEQNIKDIFEKKPKTDRLTVAVDCTIDFIDSQRMRDITCTFKDEIESGKINFVFFRSGQKLDQFGMDSYYGAPFVQINNGDPFWKPFENIHTEEVYKADPLSQQWFTLAFTYATPFLDQYRDLIFSNTREILENIPEELKPSQGIEQYLRVNTADEDYLPSFIDIKLSGPMHASRAKWVLALFYKRFYDDGHKINTRASFGFIQPNFIIIEINEVPDTTTIRFSPGLDPTQNKLIVQLMEELTFKES